MDEPSPLVSIITPTWQRHAALADRCVPSVQAQDWPHLEHIIVSDGPDPKLGESFSCPHLDKLRGVTYRELPEHDPALHWGSPARKYGASVAAGELIGYCDDDDALRPGHVRLLAEALLSDPKIMWACSRMVSHGPAGESVIGLGPLGFGMVGTPMIMHRREVLDIANWDVSAPGEDWEIVSRWLGAGLPYARVDAETVDVWPSVYHGGKL